MYFNNAFNAVTCHLMQTLVILSLVSFHSVLLTEFIYNNYDEDGPHPNMLSNNTIGNVFNASIRLGYLFD